MIKCIPTSIADAFVETHKSIITLSVAVRHTIHALESVAFKLHSGRVCVCVSVRTFLRKAVGFTAIP